MASAQKESVPNRNAEFMQLGTFLKDMHPIILTDVHPYQLSYCAVIPLTSEIGVRILPPKQKQLHIKL